MNHISLYRYKFRKLGDRLVMTPVGKQNNVAPRWCCILELVNLFQSHRQTCLLPSPLYQLLFQGLHNDKSRCLQTDWGKMLHPQLAAATPQNRSSVWEGWCRKRTYKVQLGENGNRYFAKAEFVRLNSTIDTFTWVSKANQTKQRCFGLRKDTLDKEILAQLEKGKHCTCNSSHCIMIHP